MSVKKTCIYDYVYQENYKRMECVSKRQLRQTTWSNSKRKRSNILLVALYYTSTWSHYESQYIIPRVSNHHPKAFQVSFCSCTEKKANEELICPFLFVFTVICRILSLPSLLYVSPEGSCLESCEMPEQNRENTVTL